MFGGEKSLEWLGSGIVYSVRIGELRGLRGRCAKRSLSEGWLVWWGSLGGRERGCGGCAEGLRVKWVVAVGRLLWRCLGVVASSGGGCRGLSGVVGRQVGIAGVLLGVGG